MKVRIKRLHEGAVIPRKAHSTDAGFDLTATWRSFDEDGNFVYGTGLAFEIPEGHVGLLFPRSSISKTSLLLSNAVGVIDSGYRGEVTFKFKTSVRVPSLWSRLKMQILGSDRIHIANIPVNMYEVGDRIGQLIIMPYPEIEFEESDWLTHTDREKGGYGSSGR